VKEGHEARRASTVKEAYSIPYRRRGEKEKIQTKKSEETLEAKA